MVRPLKSEQAFQQLRDYITMSGTPTELLAALQAALARVEAKIQTGSSQPERMDILIPMRQVILNEMKLYQATQVVWVYSLSDLPTAVAGVITLDSSTVYLLANIVDIGNNRLESPASLHIRGLDLERCGIVSTTTGAFITAKEDVFIYDCKLTSLTASKFFDLDNTTAGGLDTFELLQVNLETGIPAGTITGYRQVLHSGCGFFGCGGFQILGTMAGGVTVNQCIASGLPVSTRLYEFGNGTLYPVINGAIRIRNSNFSLSSGSNAVYIHNTATLPNAERWQMHDCAFLGAGTPVGGVIDQASDTTYWKDNVRLRDTYPAGNWYMQDNATATVIANTTDYVKMAGTTTIGAFTERFTHTSNRLTYTGAEVRRFKIEAIIALEAGNNNQIYCAAFKGTGVVSPTRIASSTNRSTTGGSGRAENIVVQDMVELSTTDYIEIWVRNGSATQNITAIDANFIITEL